MGGAVFPPCYLLGPNYGGGDEDNGDLLQKTPCMYCSSQCPQPCSRPPLTHTSTGDSWTLPGKSGSVSCGVTAPFSGVLVHTRFCLCPPRACTYTSYSATHCLSSLLWSVSPFMFIFFRILDLHCNPCHPHGPFQWPCGQSNQPEGFFNLSVLAPSFSSQSIMTLIVILSSPSILDSVVTILSFLPVPSEIWINRPGCMASLKGRV